MNRKVWKYLALAVAILMATVSVSGCVNPISLARSLQTAAESDSFKLTENHVDVYRYHAAQNQLYYQYMYIRFGIMNDPTGGAIKSGKMDASTYINEMLPDLRGSSDFDATAYEYAKQYLAYCEGAKEAGLYDELKEKTAADVDEYMEGLEELAEANQVSLAKYITGWMGKALNEEDVRTAMEYYYIGIEFADYLFEENSHKVTVDQLKQYVDENKEDFYSSTVTSYKLANEDMKEEIERCMTADEVKTYLVDYYLDLKFEAQYQSNIVNQKIEDPDKDLTRADIRATLLAMNGIGDAKAVFESGDTDPYKKACYNIANTINTTIKAQVNKVTESEHKWSDPETASATDLQKWLFGDDQRKVGDHAVIKTEHKDGNMTTSIYYTWYVVEENLKVDTEKTKDMHYVLISDEQKAEAFWTSLNADKTPEKFAELVAEYAPGVSGAVNERLSYETVKKSNEALANWLYAEGRREGDIYKTENKGKDGKVTGYYIAYFVQENEETWSLTAREAIAGEQLTAWYEDAVERYHVTVNYEEEDTAQNTLGGLSGDVNYSVVTPSENGGSVQFKPSENGGIFWIGGNGTTITPSTDGSSEWGTVYYDRFEVVTSESGYDGFFGVVGD